jgi:hypothetical protein
LLTHHLSKTVGEEEEVVVLDDVDEGHRVLELLLSFAAKSGDLKSDLESEVSSFFRFHIIFFVHN